MDSLSVKLLPIEHQIWRELKAHSIQKKTLILAVSGGLDSVAMMFLMKRLQPLHQCEMTVLHVHHGMAKTKIQTTYRDKVRGFVKLWSAKLGLKFKSVQYKKKKMLSSEDDFRSFRLGIFERESKGHHIIVTAHHGDDLLETQVIRLARGTGSQGLPSMVFFNGEMLRPLLPLRQKDIQAYAKSLQLKWCQDPSNKKVEPLRNWMRQVWLPQLELKSPGAIGAMIRSFAVLVQDLEKSSPKTALQNGTILRSVYFGMSVSEQRSVIADFLMRLKIRNYTSGHVEEIRRRLDNRRVRYTFTILKHEWRVNAERILAIKD